MLQQVLVLQFACLNPQHFIFEYSSIKYLVSERDKLIDQYREAKGKLILYIQPPGTNSTCKLGKSTVTEDMHVSED